MMGGPDLSQTQNYVFVGSNLFQDGYCCFKTIYFKTVVAVVYCFQLYKLVNSLHPNRQKIELPKYVESVKLCRECNG